MEERNIVKKNILECKKNILSCIGFFIIFTLVFMFFTLGTLRALDIKPRFSYKNFEEEYIDVGTMVSKSNFNKSWPNTIIEIADNNMVDIYIKDSDEKSLLLSYTNDNAYTWYNINREEDKIKYLDYAMSIQKELMNVTPNGAYTSIDDNGNITILQDFTGKRLQYFSDGSYTYRKIDILFFIKILVVLFILCALIKNFIECYIAIRGHISTLKAWNKVDNDFV